METYSLRDQAGVPLDWKIAEIVRPLAPGGGYFAEVGANDGVTQSNTFLLERKFGWSGLLVEPCVQSYQKCRYTRGGNPKNTILHGALVGSSEIQTIEGDFVANETSVDYDSLMNSIGGTRKKTGRSLVQVPAFTLCSIYTKYSLPDIDFMSLDVEGYELEVLKGIDLEAKWAPKVFLIELYNSEKEEVFTYLETYYRNCGNFTNYSKPEEPSWIEHNDYLFIRK